MKTLLYINSEDNIPAVKKYIKSNSATENIIVIATSVEARLAADMHKLDYKSYETLSHSLDNNHFGNLANEYTYKILTDKELLNLSDTNNGYSIIELMQRPCSGIIYELFMAYNFIKQIIEIEKPDKVVLDDRKSLLSYGDPYGNTTSTNGYETETLEEICQTKNIAIEKYEYSKKSFTEKLSNSFYKIFKNPGKYLDKKMAKIFKSKKTDTNEVPSQYDCKNPLIFQKTVMFYVWGNYYLAQSFGTIKKLLNQDLNLILVFVGESISYEEYNEIKNYKNLNIIYQENEKTDEANIKMFSEMENNLKPILKNILNNEDDEIIKLLSVALNTIISNQSIEIQTKWLQNEKLIKEYNPDVLYAHFDFQFDVLPYRKFGIPTLTVSHGFDNQLDFSRTVISSEYYAAQGKAIKDFYLNLFPNSDGKVFEIGEQRLQNILKTEINKNKFKEKFNLPLDKKVCIVCDCSTFKTNLPHKRHITYSLLKQAEQLAKSNKNIIFYFRVHHGIDYSYFTKYFEDLKIKNLRLSVSPTPLLTELVQTADVVISHHSSSIIETLLSGVPVIYLSQHWKVLQTYLNTVNIEHAVSYVELQEKLSKVIELNKTNKQIRDETQDFFDREFKDGLKGNNADELAKLILNLSETKSESGWQDYIERIRSNTKV